MSQLEIFSEAYLETLVGTPDFNLYLTSLQQLDIAVSKVVDRTSKDFTNYEGLCPNIARQLRAQSVSDEQYPVIEFITKRCFVTWDKFSGSRAFPVPHPVNSPLVGYTKCFDMYSGQYGKSRLNLAHHMRTQCKLAMTKMESLVFVDDF